MDSSKKSMAGQQLPKLGVELAPYDITASKLDLLLLSLYKGKELVALLPLRTGLLAACLIKSGTPDTYLTPLTPKS
ncbi:hypothetical protein [Paenibacillus albidus]|uniref:hypothetical protein n=1 Tax=Paenibacillus albidus TaxID=2041023 RepID=UPI002034A8BE|nr:hypothetical protein [Paenibacillus albidus]